MNFAPFRWSYPNIFPHRQDEVRRFCALGLTMVMSRISMLALTPGPPASPRETIRVPRVFWAGLVL